jgi:hypothetical protein
MRRVEKRQIEAPEVTLRIPGGWSGPAEFSTRLPHGSRCTANSLTLADRTSFEMNVLPADEEFPRIFADSCPKLPTEREREQIENYRVNICLTGRGGSLEAAKQMMVGAAAVMAAGGVGVFVDNSGIAHGATDWLTLLGDADNGGVYWAFVSAVRSEDEMYSLGMHVLGFRDAIIPSTGNQEYDARTLHSFLGYTAFSGATIKDGELMGDAVLPTFSAHSQADDRCPADAPMFNPYGRWRLVPLDGERN